MKKCDGCGMEFSGDHACGLSMDSPNFQNTVISVLKSINGSKAFIFSVVKSDGVITGMICGDHSLAITSLVPTISKRLLLDAKTFGENLIRAIEDSDMKNK